MTIGWAIFAVAILFLLDKYRLLKKSLILTAVALAQFAGVCACAAGQQSMEARTSAIGTHGASASMTARDYYEELYKAGGLDNFADQYVCFRDDNQPVFFLVADSDILKHFLTDVGGFEKLPSKQRDYLNRGAAFFVQYRNGLSNGMEYFDREERGRYIENILLSQKDHGSVRITKILRINWATLRYELDLGETGNSVALYSDTGKCEEVSPATRQHGH